MPESLDGYNIAPEQLPAGLSWNAETAKPYLEAAHRHNIPPAAMKALVAVQVQQEQARAEAVATLVHSAGPATLARTSTLFPASVEFIQRNVLILSRISSIWLSHYVPTGNTPTGARV